MGSTRVAGELTPLNANRRPWLTTTGDAAMTDMTNRALQALAKKIADYLRDLVHSIRSAHLSIWHASAVHAPQHVRA